MIEEMILEVLDAPKKLRIIIDTQLPSLCDISETLYYMIDRSDDCGETVIDKWHISSSAGGMVEIPTHGQLLDFVEQITRHCPDAKIWVEDY